MKRLIQAKSVEKKQNFVSLSTANVIACRDTATRRPRQASCNSDGLFGGRWYACREFAIKIGLST